MSCKDKFDQCQQVVDGDTPGDMPLNERDPSPHVRYVDNSYPARVFMETQEQKLAREFDTFAKKVLGPEFFVKKVMGRTPDHTNYEILEKKADGTVGSYSSFPKSSVRKEIRRIKEYIQKRQAEQQQCQTCGRFLRADGGCTKCEVSAFSRDATPDSIAKMDTSEAGATLGKIFEMAQNQEYRLDETRIGQVTALFRRADMSGIDGQVPAEVYSGLLAARDFRGRPLIKKAQERELTVNLVNNHTAPPEALQVAAEELVYGGGRKTDVIALANNPRFDIEGQRILAQAPNPKMRLIAATSSRTAEAVLNEMVYDLDDKVALAALRNENSPHRPQLEKAQAAGITDLETLQTIRRQGSSWQDRPRCGQCGAWTKKDGVCNNKRCGGFGRQMTVPRGRNQQGLGVEIPSPVLRRIRRSRGGLAAAQSTRQQWDEARQSGKFPPEWRAALPSAISELVATGQWEAPDGVLAWDNKTGAYSVNGVPVPADTAGEAVKTYMAWLGSRNEVEVRDDEGNPTGDTRSAWRYSPGYDGLVSAVTPEPDISGLQGGKAMDASGAPSTPPVTPKAWEAKLLTRKKGVFRHRDHHELVAHFPGSKNYAYLKDDEDFQVDGKSLKKALKFVGKYAFPIPSRQVLNRVWGLPPNSIRQDGLTAPNGVWAASDGFRMMVMAHDGEPIPDEVNIAPEFGNLINDNAPVTMGKGGAAFTGPDGHILEAKCHDEPPPDMNVVFPTTPPEYTVRITEPIPTDLIKKATLPKTAAIEIDNGDVYITVFDPAAGLDANQDDNPQRIIDRVKIGESTDKESSGQLVGINPEFFNDVARSKPAAGYWVMEVRSSNAPILFKHTSRKVLGAVMPMQIPDWGLKASP